MEGFPSNNQMKNEINKTDFKQNQILFVWM